MRERRREGGNEGEGENEGRELAEKSPTCHAPSHTSNPFLIVPHSFRTPIDLGTSYCLDPILLAV
jgi:hypothetical protein